MFLVVGHIADKPAGGTQAERYVAGWKIAGFLFGRKQDTAVHGNIIHLIKQLQACLPAGRTFKFSVISVMVSTHSHTISGSGIGMINFPPEAM